MKAAPKFNHATLCAMLCGKREGEVVAIMYADRNGDMHHGVLQSIGSRVSARTNRNLVEDIPLGHIHEALVIRA